MFTDRLCQTLIELVGLPSTSGHEEHIRGYLEPRLTEAGLTLQVDAVGNLVATLPGAGKPLLLNAHMDRVSPGLGHRPVLREGILYSDGTTNLGADDAAGIAIILEVLARIVERHLLHPPIVAVFTVQEEAGLCGSSKFDAAPYSVTDGIVFDSVGEARATPFPPHCLSRERCAVSSRLKYANATCKIFARLSSGQRRAMAAARK